MVLPSAIVPQFMFLFHDETQDDFAEMSFNSYYRSPEEYTVPFRDQTSAVYRSGLRLVALETQVTSCPVQTEWLKQENKGASSKPAQNVN